jgi:hypothetical protein
MDQDSKDLKSWKNQEKHAELEEEKTIKKENIKKKNKGTM